MTATSILPRVKPASATRGTSRAWAIGAALSVAIMLSSLIAVSLGSISIPLRDVVAVLTGGEARDARVAFIVTEIRLPRIATSALVGVALGVAGLQMQALFRNALADPYVLGVNAGASLGVALVVLSGSAALGSGAARGFSEPLSALGQGGLVIASALGAAAVLGVVMLMSLVVRNSVTLLLIGVMTGAVTGAAVNLLVVFSEPEAVQLFLLWGMGSFHGTVWSDLAVAAPAVLVAIVLAGFTVRSMNALLLGEGYARSMGVSLGRARLATMASAALLTGVVTAYCGPVGFLGLVVPHIARAIFATSNHRVLLPGCCLVGALLAVWCGAISDLPGSSTALPINVVTALLGAPVVIAVLLKRRGAELGAQGGMA